MEFWLFGIIAMERDFWSIDICSINFFFRDSWFVGSLFYFGRDEEMFDVDILYYKLLRKLISLYTERVTIKHKRKE